MCRNGSEFECDVIGLQPCAVYWGMLIASSDTFGMSCCSSYVTGCRFFCDYLSHSMPGVVASSCIAAVFVLFAFKINVRRENSLEFP